MCLNSLLSVDSYPAEGIGYKVGRIHDNAFYSLFNTSLPLQEWIEAQNFKLSTEAGFYPRDFYQSGFHVFLELEDARAYHQLLKNFYMSYETKVQSLHRTVVKVKYKNVIAAGLQAVDSKDDAICIVARDMFIEGVVECA